MLVDNIVAFYNDFRVKRLLALATFVLLLVAFRHLVPLFVFFVIFSRCFDWLSHHVGRLSGMPRKAAVGLLVVLFIGAVGAGAAVGVHRSIPLVTRATKVLPKQLESFKQLPLYQTLEEKHVDVDKYIEIAKHKMVHAVTYLQTTGRMLLHLLFGLILATVYLLEKHEMDELLGGLPKTSFPCMLVRYFSLLAESIMVMVRLQVIVALVNALLTAAVLEGMALFHMRLPHVPSLTLLVFVCGLIPVLGNFVSGAVLMAIAYLHQGWVGLAVFLVATFVLHKAESYYLNPRLASKHVRLPSLAIIVSLICFEHVFGVAGLFMSFPALFMAFGIRAYFKEQLEAVADVDATLVATQPVDAALSTGGSQAASPPPPTAPEPSSAPAPAPSAAEPAAPAPTATPAPTAPGGLVSGAPVADAPASVAAAASKA